MNYSYAVRTLSQNYPYTGDGLNHEDTATTSRSTLQRGLQNMIEADLVNQIGQPATMEEIVLAQMYMLRIRDYDEMYIISSSAFV